MSWIPYGDEEIYFMSVMYIAFLYPEWTNEWTLLCLRSIKIETHQNYTDSNFNNKFSDLIARQVFPFNLHPVHCIIPLLAQYFNFEYLNFDQKHDSKIMNIKKERNL